MDDKPKLVALRPPEKAQNEQPEPPNEYLVQMMADAHKAAESGDMVGVAGISVTREGNIKIFLNPGEDEHVVTLLGGLEMLKATLIENYCYIPPEDA